MPHQETQATPPQAFIKPPMNRILKWLLIAAAAVALYAILGFAVVPRVALSLGQSQLSEALQRSATIQEVHFNPFTLALELKGLKVLEPDGDKVFVALQGLRTDIRVLSLFRLALGLDEVLLEEPYVHISQDKDGRFNFSNLLTGGEADPTEPSANGVGFFPFIIYNFSIQGGTLIFDDQSRGKQHKVEDIELSVPFTSSLSGDRKEYVTPSLRATLNGTPLVLEGRTRPFEDTLRTEFNFNLDKQDLTQYWAYAPLPPQAALHSGTLSCDLSLGFQQQGAGLPQISIMGQVQAGDIDLSLDGQPLASFKELAVEINGLSLSQQILELGLVRLRGAKTSVVLDEHGALNWSRLVPADPKAATPATPVSAQKNKNGQPGGFSVIVQRVELQQGTVLFQDKARGFSSTIGPLDLGINELNSSGGDTNFTLDAGLGGPQHIAASGTFNPASLNSAGTLDLTDFNVTALAPYYGDALPAELLSCTASASLHYMLRTGDDSALTLGQASLDLTDIALRRKDGKGATAVVQALRLADGEIDALAASGSLREVVLEGASLSVTPGAAKAHPFGTLQGITLTDLTFAASPAKAHLGQFLLKGLSVTAPGDAAPALSLARLEVSPMAYDAEQGTLDIKRTLALTPKLATILDAQGRSSLERIVSAVTGEPLPEKVSAPLTPETASPSPTPGNQAAEPLAEKASDTSGAASAPEPRSPLAQQDMRFSLANLEIREGTVSFRDESISPPYATSLDNLAGRLENVSTAVGAPPATLVLTGSVDKHAPLILEGSASPTDLGLNPRMHLTLTNMDLTALSPYTAKFMSYSLATGQLSLDINTVVEGAEVKSNNTFRLSSINLGSYQKSPNDMGIPLSLALALLADRSGNVQLDVPVRGNLNDPQFHLGPVIFKAVFNLLFKAVTSPFALLGSLFGGGEDLGALPMPPGLATLGPDASAKLDSLAKALDERPRLKLQVSGTASPTADRTALTELRFQRAIKAPRYQELQDKGQAPASVDEVVLNNEEYPGYLEEAYADAEFDKEKNAFGLLKGQPVEVMEQLLRQHLAATDQDALELGRQRAALVKDALLERGVDPGRVFLREATPKDAGQTPMGVALTFQ